MTRKEIEDVVKCIINRKTGIKVEDINDDSTAEKFDLDSLDICEIWMDIEDEFDLLISNEEIVKSFKELIDLVQEKLKCRI